MAFFTLESIRDSLHSLRGTADHMIKIWFTLKHMGLVEGGGSIEVTTANSKESLDQLFSCRHPDGKYLIPFATTARFNTMMSDASRSIIQTNMKKWDDGTNTGADPTDFLLIEKTGGSYNVSTNRGYPMGLGHGINGFAKDDDTKVNIPLKAMAVWYCRIRDVASTDAAVETMLSELNISDFEKELLFEDHHFEPTLQENAISDSELVSLYDEPFSLIGTPVVMARDVYEAEVKSMKTNVLGPRWLNYRAEESLKNLLDNGRKAVLLYGPPRTSKTHTIRSLVPSDETTYIQIHDGWTYGDLVLGLKPKQNGEWEYVPGPLLSALREGKKYIVLEEINRTEFSSAIGELFSLLEESYRGEEYEITLADESKIFVPKETVFLLTMNNIDISTEPIDDAIFGRVDGIGFSPRVESLTLILKSTELSKEAKKSLRLLFNKIQEIHPIGHGFFAGADEFDGIIDFYLHKIRPLLEKHTAGSRTGELYEIDEFVDHLHQTMSA